MPQNFAMAGIYASQRKQAGEVTPSAGRAHDGPVARRSNGMPLFLQRAADPSNSGPGAGGAATPHGSTMPGDARDKQADRIAERVMGMPSPASALPIGSREVTAAP